MKNLPYELFFSVEELVKVLAMWPGAKNPECFPEMKKARKLIARCEKELLHAHKNNHVNDLCETWGCDLRSHVHVRIAEDEHGH